MSTIAELGAFLARESAAAAEPESSPPITVPKPTAAVGNGTPNRGECVVIVIAGLIVLLVAVIVAITGVLANA